MAWALVVFAWLTLRHIHDSVFLEDQTDQLQNFEALLRLQPEALLGPPMSGTRPTAHAFGPIGAIVLGLPVALGLGIDGTHAITSLLIAGAAAVAFLVLLRIDEPFAWLWFLVFSATGLVWWNAGLFWASTLLLPLGVLLLAVAASCLGRPSLFTIALLILTVVLAMQIHPAAGVAVPVVAIVALVSTLSPGPLGGARPTQRQSLAIAALTLVAVGPYVVSESLTRLQNSRAMLAHVQQATEEQALAVDTAEQTLLIASDPTGALADVGLSNRAVIAVGAALAAVAVVALWKTRSSRGDARRVLLWLTVATIVGVGTQATFFALMRRPLGGYHYVSLLAPFYAVVPAAFLREVLARFLDRRRAPIVLACACVAFLVWTGPSRADRAMAPAMWSYRNIVAAVNDLCDGGVADTAEGDGFAATVNPHHDGVLQYLMKRNFTNCRYQPGSAVLIAASRDGHFADWHVANGQRYRRDTVRFPGIALYRRVPPDQGNAATSN